MTNEENKSKPTYYVTYDFMIKDLALSGAELSVFALLFSFFKATDEFRGSWKYISERTGLGNSSVGAAIKSLREKKLIEKKEEGKAGEYSYTLTASAKTNIGKLIASGASPLQENPNFGVPHPNFGGGSANFESDASKNRTGGIQNSDEGHPKSGYNNKEDKKEYIKDDILLTREGARESTQKEFFEDEGREGGPNYREGRSTKRGGRVGNRPVYQNVGRGCQSPFRSPDAPRTQIGREVEARVRKFYEEERSLWKDEIDELLGRK